MGWPKWVKNPRDKHYAPLVQSSKVPGWYPALFAECHPGTSDKIGKIWKFWPEESIFFDTLRQWCVKFLSRTFYPFWPPYGQKFWFGIFDLGANRWWVKFENYDLRRVFCFGTLYQWYVKFLSRTFYPFWPPYGWKFQFGTFGWGATSWYFWPWCNQKRCSVLSTVVWVFLYLRSLTSSVTSDGFTATKK